MSKYVGDFAADSTVYIDWSTNDGDGGADNPSAAGTIKVYKDNGATERTSLSGVTDSRDFDSHDGLQMLAVDTSDDTDTDFYAAGHDYFVALVSATIDSQTVTSWLGHFSIENRFAGVPAGMATSAGQTSTQGLVTTVDGVVDAIQAVTDNLPDGGALSSLGTATAQTTINNNLLRALGLVQENQYIDTYVFDTNIPFPRVTSFRLRTYSVAGSVGSASNVLATYTGTVTYGTDGIASYKLVKV